MTLRALLFIALSAAACAPAPSGPDAEARFAASGEAPGAREAPFASLDATLVAFDFDASLLAPQGVDPARYAADQLLYTVGQLNAHHSVARLGHLEISELQVAKEGSLARVSYHARIPVGWGDAEPPPSFELVLPERVTSPGLQAFAAKYSPACVEGSDHAVSPGNFWYHFRPASPGCVLHDDDTVRATAVVTPLGEDTEGKYPEYDLMWEDGELVVLAVFGKYEHGATHPDDAGISAYDTFLARAASELGLELAAPASLPPGPGVAAPDVTLTGWHLGRPVRLHALLVDAPSAAGPKFDARYAALTPDADVIMYSGHAGLGKNVRALADKGAFLPGKHQLFFLNGCDTFAYLDDRLAERRAALNPDDPSGTKYMDVLTNLMPAYFHAMPSAALAVVEAMLARDAPRTYEEIFAGIDEVQGVVVTGEEDNAFGPGVASGWAGQSRVGAVGEGDVERLETPRLPAGRYRIELAGVASKPGGDADVYVAVDRPATTSDYDHAPYLATSDEVVTLEISSGSRLHVLVHGYDAGPWGAAHYELAVTREP